MLGEGNLPAGRPAASLDDLVRQGIPVVMAVCRRIARRLGGAVPLDDLTGIGNLALVDVARAWDPARANFVAFAASRLRWAILDGLRRETHSRSTSARAAALLASDRLAEALADTPEPPSLTTVEEDQAALASVLESHAAALAVGLLASPEETSAEETPENEVERAELSHVVKGAIGALPERERALMLRHYYGGEPFDAIALDLGISKSWASRLHERAIVAVKLAVHTPLRDASATP